MNIMLCTDEQCQNYLQQWHKWLKTQRNYSPHTLEAYQQDGNNFFIFLAQNEATIITENMLPTLEPHHFRSWLAYRKKNKYCNSSNARALAAIRSFFRYLDRFCHIHNPAVRYVKTPSKEDLIPKALNTEDTTAMIDNIDAAHIENQHWIGLRDIALLTLIYGSGLRINEALMLNYSDYNKDSKTITVIGKGKKERIIPILPIIHQTMKSYLNNRPWDTTPASPLFVGMKGGRLQAGVFQRAVRNVRKSLNLSDSVTPHAFRHSFATHLLHNGGDLRSIQELLGHDSLSTTQHYTKVDVSRIFETWSECHPLERTKKEPL